ncbi:MAG: hypothetical protein RR319_01260 [Bacteroides sp.]
MELIVKASSLTVEEQFCLCGYMFAVNNNSMQEQEARVQAYKLSRTRKKLSTENELSIKRLADRFLATGKAKAFMLLQNDNENKEKEDKANIIPVDLDDMEEVNLDDEKVANKLYAELEERKTNCDADTLIKLVNAQANIIHKNKDNFKEDNKQVRYYLPLRCYDCELHKRAEKEL